MPDFGDISGLPPVTLDPTSDLGSLAWPWDMPASPAPSAAAIPGAVDVAVAAPPIPDVAAPDGAMVPGAAPLAPGGELPLAPPAAAAPLAAPTEPLPATQPGMGIPRAVLDAIVPPAPVSPIPAGASGIAPPGAIPLAAPAAVQPLTPAAGATAFDQAPPAELAALAPAPLGEPGLPPAPSPFPPPPPIDQGLLPDAISGRIEQTYGAPSEPVFGGDAAMRMTPEQRYAAVAGEYHRDPNKLLDRLEQPGALDANTQRYLDEFAARDPAGAAVVQQRLRDAGTMRAAAERAHIAKDTLDKQMANLDRLNKARAEAAKKSAEIDAEATNIAATKVGYHPSTFQRIAGVIAAVVGGLYQGRTGSARNPGLDALNDVINRDLEEQRFNLTNRRDVLAQRRSALGELTARSNDQYQADETMRLAALKYADEQLAQQQLNFAPDGTRGLNLATMRAGLNAQIAANREVRDGKLFDRAVKVQDAARQQQIADQTNWKNRADVSLGYARINEDAAQRKEARDARAADKATERADKEAERRRQFAIGGIPRIQMGQDGKAVIGADGKPVVIYDDLRNADGAVWEAESPEATRELRQKKSSATEVVSIIDEIRGIRDRVGGESKLLNSDDAQRLQVLQARAKLLTKSGTQGMSSDKDMETLEDAAGTSSATSWRSQEARLLEARSRTESALNVAFRDAKYSGAPIAFPRSEPSKNTPVEDRVQRLIEKPNISYDAALQQAIGYRRPANAPTLGDEESAALASAARAEAEQYKEISPQQRRDLVQLQLDAVKDPAALASLKGVAAQAHSKTLRDFAARAVIGVERKIKDADYPMILEGDPALLAGGQ